MTRRAKGKASMVKAPEFELLAGVNFDQGKYLLNEDMIVAVIIAG